MNETNGLAVGPMEDQRDFARGVSSRSKKSLCCEPTCRVYASSPGGTLEILPIRHGEAADFNEHGLDGSRAGLACGWQIVGRNESSVCYLLGESHA